MDEIDRNLERIERAVQKFDLARAGKKLDEVAVFSPSPNDGPSVSGSPRHTDVPLAAPQPRERAPSAPIPPDWLAEPSEPQTDDEVERLPKRVWRWIKRLASVQRWRKGHGR